MPLLLVFASIQHTLTHYPLSGTPSFLLLIKQHLTCLLTNSNLPTAHLNIPSCRWYHHQLAFPRVVVSAAAQRIYRPHTPQSFHADGPRSRETIRHQRGLSIEWFDLPSGLSVFLDSAGRRPPSLDRLLLVCRLRLSGPALRQRDVHPFHTIRPHHLRADQSADGAGAHGEQRGTHGDGPGRCASVSATPHPRHAHTRDTHIRRNTSSTNYHHHHEQFYHRCYYWIPPQ